MDKEAILDNSSVCSQVIGLASFEIGVITKKACGVRVRSKIQPSPFIPVSNGERMEKAPSWFSHLNLFYSSSSLPSLRRLGLSLLKRRACRRLFFPNYGCIFQGCWEILYETEKKWKGETGYVSEILLSLSLALSRSSSRYGSTAAAAPAIQMQSNLIHYTQKQQKEKRNPSGPYVTRI